MFTELITDKTFFIMENDEVKTYHKCIVNKEFKIVVCVYERNIPYKLAHLVPEDVVETITEHSEDYIKRMGKLIHFISKTLKNTLLRDYVINIWNGNKEEAEQCFLEDSSVTEKFLLYCNQLIQTYTDKNIVLLFKELYFEQEVIHAKYSLEWIESVKRL